MGGSLNMTVRRENETIHSFNTWTGSEDELFHNKEFNEGRYDEALDNFILYLKKHSKDENFIIKDLSPEWYGLIVVDFKEKIIHSMQSYNEPANIFVGRFSPYMTISTKESDKFDELMRLNYLDVYNGNKDKKSIQEVFGTDVSTQIISKLLTKVFKNQDKDNVKNDFFSNIFLLEIKPKEFRNFTIKNYNSDHKGKTKFQNNLERSGFNLSEKDRQQWKDFS